MVSDLLEPLLRELLAEPFLIMPPTSFLWNLLTRPANLNVAMLPDRTLATMRDKEQIVP